MTTTGLEKGAMLVAMLWACITVGVSVVNLVRRSRRVHVPQDVIYALMPLCLPLSCAYVLYRLKTDPWHDQRRDTL